MPGTNRIPDEAGSMTHAKIPEPVKTGKPFYLKTEIPKELHTEITKSISVHGIHEGTTLAEEMVEDVLQPLIPS